VIAEVEDEVSLKKAGGGVREAAAAKARMNGQPTAARDPTALVYALERERCGRLIVELDDETTGRLRILVLPFELPRKRIAVEWLAGGEERTHVVVGQDVL
jgi:hypothetical protein